MADLVALTTKEAIRQRAASTLLDVWHVMPASFTFGEATVLFAQALEDAGLLVAPMDLSDRHIIYYGKTGWTVMHPLSCRPTGLFTCLVGSRARDAEERPQALGQYYCGLDDDGHFQHYERVITNG